MSDFNDLLLEFGVATPNHDPPPSENGDEQIAAESYRDHEPSDLYYRYPLDIDVPAPSVTEEQHPPTSEDTFRQYEYHQAGQDAERIDPDYEEEYEEPEAPERSIKRTRQTEAMKRALNECMSRLPENWWADCLLIGVSIGIGISVVKHLPEILLALARMIYSLTSVVLTLSLIVGILFTIIIGVRWRRRRRYYRTGRRWLI